MACLVLLFAAAVVRAVVAAMGAERRPKSGEEAVIPCDRHDDGLLAIDPDSKLCVHRSPHRAAGRGTTRTGQAAVRTTRSATLPMSR